MSDKLIGCKEGEEVTIGRGDRAVTATVKPPCDDPRNGRWYCLTHDERFDNQFQKDVHIHTGRHKLAWICCEHGAEACG